MEYMYYIALLALFIFLAKFIFAKRQVENIPIELEIIEKSIEKKVPKKEVLYQFNKNAIKLNLYQNNTFMNRYLEDLYERIVVKNYWIKEPFHTSFANIIYHISINRFCIKSSKSQNIIINMCDIDGIETRDTALQVLDIKETVCSVVLKIYKSKRNLIETNELQILLLSSMVYTLAKADNIDFITHENEDEKQYWKRGIEVFYSDYSTANKMKILPTNNSYFELIRITFNEVVVFANEYPANLHTINNQKNSIKKLLGIPKKQLCSINSYHHNVL
jgi:hypothetical protein